MEKTPPLSASDRKKLMPFLDRLEEVEITQILKRAIAKNESHQKDILSQDISHKKNFIIDRDLLIDDEVVSGTANAIIA